ncbi:MAG: hypothetical protein FWF79_02340 [Defluviitaleaceae bacterium]|nr:hypothetical protein [Defluviitaleaceae bacterium]
MSFSASLVIALFFGFVVVYMVFRAYGALTPDVDLMTVRLGNIEMQQSVPGIIIRHEEVFTANRDGRIVFAVQEFDMVRGNDLVASIRDFEAVDRSTRDMAVLQQEIINVHEMRIQTPSDPLIDRINNDLQRQMDRSMPHHVQMNLSEIYRLLDTLTRITDNRNQMITDESAHIRGDLSLRNEHLTAQLSMSLSDVYAGRGGIMSPVIDGYENLKTPDNMRVLNREQTRRQIDTEVIVPGREVSAGDEIFKIVGNAWYVAAHMPNAIAHVFTLGEDRNIYLENVTTGRFERVPMRIYYMDYRHSYTLVIFRSTRNVIEFLNQRSVNIRITDSVQSGFVIPTTAITTRRFFRIPLTHIHGSEEYFIMHRREDGIQPVPVHIYERSTFYAYILEETLTLVPGDILTPVYPDDGHHLIIDADIWIERGVFRTTMNFADFRVIHLDAEIPEGAGRVVLDPARNTGIRQFDTIATDASRVRQGQVVR